MVVLDDDGNPHDIYYYQDRSGAETDDTCGMRYWWNRIESGGGIVSKDEAEELRVGREIHDDFHRIGQIEGEDLEPALKAQIQEILTAATAPDFNPQEKMEVLYRRLGWIAAWGLYMEPRLRKEFENVASEDEIILDRDPLWTAITPDRLLRHRQGNYLVYKEFKSTITANQKWITSWPFAIQLHLGLKGIEEEYQEKVAYGQVVGVMKGDNRGGRLGHPYVWAWWNERTGEWTHDYDKARSHDWQHRPVWEYPEGVLAWVKKCGEEVAQSQFPNSVPVFLNERMLNDWVTRRTARCIEISEVAEECSLDWNKRVMYFEPRTKNCRPPFGSMCPYIMACHNAEINANPLASGVYVKRIPHHAIELTLIGGGDDGS